MPNVEPLLSYRPLRISVQKDPDARPIREVTELAELAVDTSTAGTRWGTGGMVTKLIASRIATAGGCNTVRLVMGTIAGD